MDRRLAVVGLATAIVIGGAGVAVAGVSDGNYQPADQRCTGHADDRDQSGSDDGTRVEEGCQNATVYVGDQAGGEAIRAGYQQTASGEFIDPTQPQISTGEIDPTSGLRVYFGADDNLDGGEHDSSPYIGDGPSDGGAIQFNIRPGAVEEWAAHAQAGDAGWLLAHPLPLIDFGTGACADGVCFAVTTQRRLAYDNDKRRSRDVADYEGHTWDPETCSGPDDSAEACGHNGIAWWQKHGEDAYVEPGAQVFEDPNPAGSPIGPYPIPALYVGTCGVIAGGGVAPAAPDSPITNGAGQISVTSGDLDPSAACSG